MTTMLAPTCPLSHEGTDQPDCSRRLVLHECLEALEQRAELGIVDTGRYRCRFVVWGKGPTLVLIPGMGTDSRAFAMLMARLSPFFRCVSYDLPDGRGDGAHLMSYRHCDLAGDLLALLDHLALPQCAVLGSSFGATIALAALHAQPHRFSRAMLQGGFARRPLAPAEVLAASFARFWPGNLGDLPLVERVLSMKAEAEFAGREPEVWRFFVEQNLTIPLQAFALRALMIHRLDLRPILPTIRHPVMLVCGDRDTLVGKECERELMNGLPTAARAEIENCGHVPQFTHPEVLAEVVRHFLAPAACG